MKRWKTFSKKKDWKDGKLFSKKKKMKRWKFFSKKMKVFLLQKKRWWKMEKFLVSMLILRKLKKNWICEYAIISLFFLQKKFSFASAFQLQNKIMLTEKPSTQLTTKTFKHETISQIKVSTSSWRERKTTSKQTRSCRFTKTTPFRSFDASPFRNPAWSLSLLHLKKTQLRKHDVLS